MPGYDCLEDRGPVDVINDLYANEWSLYQNHFCPSMKLLSKRRINSKYYKKYYKKYDPPQTSHHRVMGSDHVTDGTRRWDQTRDSDPCAHMGTKKPPQRRLQENAQFLLDAVDQVINGSPNFIVGAVGTTALGNHAGAGQTSNAAVV